MRRLILLVLVSFAHLAKASNRIFIGCSASSYYSDLSRDDIEDWSWDDLRALVTNTHRNVVPYLGTDGDTVWDALEDVDFLEQPSDGTDTGESLSEFVTLGAPIEPTDWEVDHLWPAHRGLNADEPEYTDIHNLRLSSSEYAVFREGLFFGECGIACDDAYCRRPAFPDGESDTASDGVIFLPPKDKRGDIARSLLYMELRYSTLKLTNCPASQSQMGYLSVLLQWHLDDPPDENEKLRNGRVCQSWQGNRNPFVDVPLLVEKFWGSPDDLRSGNKCLEYPPSSHSANCYLEDELFDDSSGLSPREASGAVIGLSVGWIALTGIVAALFICFV